MKTRWSVLSALLVAVATQVGAQTSQPAAVPALPAQAAEKAQAEAQGATPAPAFVPFKDAIPASEVTAEMLGKEIAITGAIVEAIPSSAERTPSRIILDRREDGTEVMFVFWQESNEAVYGDKGVPAAGTKVSVRGQLQEHRKALQIRVRDVEQVRMEGYPHTLAAAANSGQFAPDADGYFVVGQSGQLKGSKIGAKISVRGKVSEFRASWSDTAPNVITMADGKDKMEVVFWDDNVAPFQEPGTPIYVTGELQDYRGRLQVKVNAMQDLSTKPLPKDRIARPAAKAEPATGPATSWPGAPKLDKAPELPKVEVEPGTMLELNKISPAHEGNTVRVSGAVQRIMSSETEDVLLLAADGSTLIVRLPAGAAASVAVRDLVEAEGTVKYNQVRSQPELVVSGAEKVSKLK